MYTVAVSCSRRGVGVSVPQELQAVLKDCFLFQDCFELFLQIFEYLCCTRTKLEKPILYLAESESNRFRELEVNKGLAG